MSRARRDTDVWFRDVTNDLEARRHADWVPELRTAFETLGFRRVGFLGDYLIPGGPLRVHEVLSSPKADTFLTLALSPAHPLISEPRSIPTAILESVLEDGSILITTTNPGPLWRLNHPRAGLYLEGSIEAEPEELWRRHQQRLEGLAARRDRSVLPHVSMRLRLWIAERSNEVGNYVAVVALLIGVFTFVGILIQFVRFKDWFDARGRVWFGAFWPLFWVVCLVTLSGIAWWIVRSRVVRGWLAGQWLARQFPWPRRRPYDL